MPHACVFKSLGFINAEGKVIKETNMNSKAEFAKLGNEAAKTANVMLISHS